MKLTLPTLLAISISLVISSCGYRTGSIGGSSLDGIRKIHVPVVENETFQPALGPMVTDAVIQRLMRDGTLIVSNEKNADAVLKIKLTDIERRSQRSARSDDRRTAEYQVRIRADIEGKRLSDGTTFFNSNNLSGFTDYFVGQDLPEGERQALGLAANHLAENIVLHLVEGW